MRINSYNIGMDSARLYRSESVRYTGKSGQALSAQGSENALNTFEGFLTQGQKKEEEDDNSKISRPPVDLDAAISLQKIDGHDIIGQNERSAQNQFQKLHEYMIQHIFELLFGSHHGNTDDYLREATADSGSFSPNYELVPVTYQTGGYFSETESTTFQATGQVQTSDGRTIDFNVNIAMSRTFTSYFETTISTFEQKVCDPLVINFDTDLADLSDMSFFFDLDCDGQEEKINRLTAGSGFLALDLNNDGIINDGSELFGPQSGNGFADLAKFDEDGNGWIDEADSVFEKLRIWTKDANGNDVLYSLKDKNVGALFLGAADTQFSLNDVMNATKGYVRQTGLFLYESGEVGTMQHIDLVS